MNYDLTIKDGELITVNCKNKKLELDIILPDTVTKIGSHAFQNIKLRSITLPDSIEEIGAYAFDQCDQIKEIIMPDSIKTIGVNAFEWCTGLKTVRLSRSLKEIPSLCFFWSNLESIEIPESVTVINHSAFAQCYNLKHVTVSKNLIQLMGQAFTRCEQLESISLPKSLKFIGESAFLGCINLKSADIPNKTYIGEKAFEMCESLESIKIPKCDIPDSAFRQCKKLKHVEIPDGVVTIHENAFAGCASLKSIDIPKSIIAIGAKAFYDCTSLEAVNFDKDSHLKSINDDTFCNCESLKRITIPKSMQIITGPKGSLKNRNLEYIDVDPDNQDFASVNGVLYSKHKNILYQYPQNFPDTKVTIIKSVNEIATGAFSDCRNIKHIIVLPMVSKIEMSAFDNCENLETLEIRANIKSIKNIVTHCPNLKTLIVPISVKHTGDWYEVGSPLENVGLFNKIFTDSTENCIGLLDSYEAIRCNRKFNPDLARYIINIYEKTKSHEAKTYMQRHIVSMTKACENDINSVNILIPLFKSANKIDDALNIITNVEAKVIIERYKHEHFGKRQKLKL